jgi:hypothetical protein
MYPADGPPVVDRLGEVLTADLNLRAGPSTTSDRLGVLPKGGWFIVLAGPRIVDGYAWYQIAAVLPLEGGCARSEPPLLDCANWLGWAAAGSPTGERWLGALAIDCPAGRDTATYLSMTPAQRLACAGGGEWQLRAYLAPSTDGRGCAPSWTTEPAWLDGACNFIFPQPAATEFDVDSSLPAWVAPVLGKCPSLNEPSCPLGRYRGSWVVLLGHLDDPAAHSCRAVPSGIDGTNFDPPSADQVVLDCRLRFAVRGVLGAQSTAPAPNTGDFDRPPGYAIPSLPFTHAIDASNAVPNANASGRCAGGMAGTWYTFTSSEAQVVVADTFGSSYNTVIDVWAWPLNVPLNYQNFPAVSDRVEVACNDDTGGGTASEVVFAAAAGRTYVITVTTAGSTTPGFLTFHLSRG